MSEDKKLLIRRDELIKKVSDELINIRKESKLTQDELGNILGISKNTIVNVEKGGKQLSWAVVMSVVMLFNQANSIKSIIGETSPLEIISQCAFLDGDSGKNNMLYTTSISSLAALTLVPIVGGAIASGIYELFNKNNSKK